MLDYYSNFPGPSKEEAIKQVVIEIGEEKIVRDIISVTNIGSYTGWYAYFKSYIIDKVKIKVKNMKCEKYWVEYVMKKIIGDDTFTY